MPLPIQPVTLSTDQVSELSKRLADLRHDVNNDLALIIAAVEIVRRKPESAERMWNGLSEKPRKIAEAVTSFSRELERLLGVTRP